MAEETEAIVCRLCQAEPASCPDPHLGPVCAGCYADLVIVRSVLDEIGPLAGLAGCADPRISTERKEP